MYMLTNTVGAVNLLQVFRNESVIKKCAGAAAGAAAAPCKANAHDVEIFSTAQH